MDRHLPADQIGVDSLGHAVDLNDAVADHGIDPTEAGKTNDAVIAHDTDLERFPTAKVHDEGNHTGLREIDGLQRIVRLEQPLSCTQWHTLQVGFQAFEDGMRKLGQQVIPDPGRG